MAGIHCVQLRGDQMTLALANVLDRFVGAGIDLKRVCYHVQGQAVRSLVDHCQNGFVIEHRLYGTLILNRSFWTLADKRKITIRLGVPPRAKVRFQRKVILELEKV